MNLCDVIGQIKLIQLVATHLIELSPSYQVDSTATLLGI